MKITLIYPLLSRPRATVDENKQFWPPLGLGYIAALLEKYGHKVSIIDRDVLLRKNRLDFERTDTLTLEGVRSFDADIIGISATTPNMFDVYHLAGILKKDDTSRKIILGGPHATAEPVATLQECQDIDLIVRGEGEFTVLEVANGKDLHEIEGISFRDNTKVINNPGRNLCPDLDELPFPARHLLDMAFYTRPSRFIGRGRNLRTTSIFTARGCPYRCDFCAGHIMFPGKVRFHSAQRITAEMEYLVRNYNVEAIYIADDMFLSNRQRALEFLELFRKNEALKNTKWIAQARASVVDEAMLKALKGSGCISLEYGFESGSQHTLDLMGKNAKVEDNLRAARLTRKAGLGFTGFIIAGYPGETESDFKKTISFLKKARPTVIAMSLFYPLPGTAVYNRLVSQKQKIPAWDRIGDPEAVDINYADMDKAKFQKLYFSAKLTLVLPNNLYYFIRNNINSPLGLIKAFATQFRGVFTRSLHAVIKLFQLINKSPKRLSGKEGLRVLFVSYNGLLEPILPSQGIPYLKELSKKETDFILLTFEKKQDLMRTGKEGLEGIRRDLARFKIKWVWLSYHKEPRQISTFLDIILCSFYSAYLILRYKIKLVHLRGVTLGPMMILFRRVFKIRFIFDMRGLLAEEYVGGGLWKEGRLIFKAVKWVERSLLKIADGVVVLTEKHYALNKELPHLKDRGIPMEVIPCCVDLDRFKNNGSHTQGFTDNSLMKDSLIFMYPGKIGTFYLTSEMLDFFSFALKHIPQSLFVVLTQDDTALLLNAAKEKGIGADKIKIIRPEFEEIPAYLSLADYGIFFINPYKKFGSSPIKLGEFLACGKPVIINPGIGDSEELVRRSRVGVVVNNFRDEDYSIALAELLRFNQEKDILSQRCRQAAKDYLSLELGVGRYSRIYRKVAGELI